MTKPIYDFHMLLSGKNIFVKLYRVYNFFPEYFLKLISHLKLNVGKLLLFSADVSAKQTQWSPEQKCHLQQCCDTNVTSEVLQMSNPTINSNDDETILILEITQMLAICQAL